MYVLSGVLVLAATWYEGRTSGTKLEELGLTQGRWKAQQTADWLLGVCLFISAFLPASSQSFGALGWRLMIALATLLRLIIVSKPIFQEAGLGRLLVMASAVLGLCGIGFYWIDPEVSSFSEGLWLAFSTAATVGYGDVVPSTTASRIFSVFVVLLGYGVLSLVTASIAALAASVFPAVGAAPTVHDSRTSARRADGMRSLGDGSGRSNTKNPYCQRTTPRKHHNTSRIK